jgi:rod shape determining protein RodA
MPRSFGLITLSRVLGFSIAMLILLSIVILNSIGSAFFPSYYIYIVSSILIFVLFSRIDFDVLMAFAPYFYIISILSLCLPLAMGEITRGAIRWIQIGSITFQPSELVRPFLLLFFAKYVSETSVTVKNIAIGLVLMTLPVFLILVQPSFGVSLLTTVGFAGILLTSRVPKKVFFGGILVALLSIPLVWFMLAPYQKQRVSSFLHPTNDPLGAGYNSLQSMISIGSGRIFGRGLGEGVQTQLAFLPEKHSDFVFAGIAEEMGLVGTLLLLIGIFSLFWCLIAIAESSKSEVARSYTIGVCLALFVQTMIHTGMNMGMLPITGVPFPLVSAGGSALLGTMVSLGIIISGWKYRS